MTWSILSSALNTTSVPELPTSLVREITDTEPAVKGDTSGKVLKKAKIATGFEISVPLFVQTGDKVEIDTRTHEYRKRV